MSYRPPAAKGAIAPVVAARVKAIRHALRMSQRQLAEKAGVSVPAVTLIENGSRIPSLEMIEVLAAALDASPWALLVAPEPCGRCGGHPIPGFLCIACGTFR